MKRLEPIDAFSIVHFCERHDISVAHYYRLRAEGKTPVEMKLGGRIIISREAAERWRRDRETMSPISIKEMTTMTGPGKYDDLCSYVTERTKIAERGGGVILIVINGDKGNGFDVQADFGTMLTIPDLLERIAQEIRQDMQQGKA